MFKRTHTLQEATAKLGKLGVTQDEDGILNIPTRKLGNKSWGLVDFMRKNGFAKGWVFKGLA